MSALDPLLHHLHRRGGGAWSNFAHAVENFDFDVNPMACARLLSEHGLVEFDFTGARDWSVTSVQLVSSASGISAWGGTGRHLADSGIEVEIRERTGWIGSRSMSYDHAVRVRKRDTWPTGLEPIAADDVLRALPSMTAMIGAKPMDRTPERRAERLTIRTEERRNPDGGFRRTVLLGDWQAVERIDAGRPGTWRIDRRTLMITRNHTCFNPSQEAALWYGFALAAERLGYENLAMYDSPNLHIARYPPLPPPYARSLLLSGARECRSPRPERRTFTNVRAPLVAWLSDKLGFTITDVSEET